MKILLKNEKIIRYLYDAFSIARNATIFINELMPRLDNQDGIAYLLVNCEIPPNHELEWGYIGEHNSVGNTIYFLQTFRREKDILFLFADANFIKTDPCWERKRNIERNVIFYENHPFYFATPFNSTEYLRTTLKNANCSLPSFGFIIKGDYIFHDWQDITETTLRKILKDTIAIITTVFDGEAYMVYEFQNEKSRLEIKFN